MLHAKESGLSSPVFQASVPHHFAKGKTQKNASRRFAQPTGESVTSFPIPCLLCTPFRAPGYLIRRLLVDPRQLEEQRLQLLVVLVLWKGRLRLTQLRDLQLQGVAFRTHGRGEGVFFGIADEVKLVRAEAVRYCAVLRALRGADSREPI